MTALQKLDDAIHEFVKETGLADGGFVTGWALGFTAAKIQPNPEFLPMGSLISYTVSPSTSIAEMAGIGRFLSVVAERAMLESTE